MRILHMVLVNLSRSITQKHTQPPLVMSSVCEEAYVPLSTQMPLFTSTHHPSPTETEIDKSIHSLRCDHDPSQLSPHYPIRIAQTTPYNQATPSHPDPSMSTFSTACISHCPISRSNPLMWHHVHAQTEIFLPLVSALPLIE